MTLLRLLRGPRWAWLVALALVGLEGCAHKPGIGMLPLAYAPPFSDSGEAYVPNLWWTAFGDSALNDEIDRCLGGSFTLAAAFQRLSAADALTRREASDLWPDVNGFGEAEGIFRSGEESVSAYALGIDVSYQVDLWGQIGARVDAQRLRTTATLADYQAVALTLTADVATTWFALIEGHAQVALLNKQLEINRAVLDVLEARFGFGQSRSPDVLRQRQLVESTREQWVVVQARIDVLEHQLAVLQGWASASCSPPPSFWCSSLACTSSLKTSRRFLHQALLTDCFET